MATNIAEYRGYKIMLAALQPSKARLGGTTRSIQVLKNSIIKHQIRFKTDKAGAQDKACEYARRWIDRKELEVQNAR
jgi:hypothetical protein